VLIKFSLSTARYASLSKTVEAFLGAFIEGELEVPEHLARRVYDLYFNPQHAEFAPGTMWSLSSAFTSAFKKLDPIPQFKATAKLGAAGGCYFKAPPAKCGPCLGSTSIRNAIGHKFVRRGDVDAAMQCPVKGTVHRIASVHFCHDLPNVFWSHDPVMDEDAPNYQNSLFSLHLAADIAAQCPTACFDLPRCQRGGKRAL